MFKLMHGISLAVATLIAPAAMAQAVDTPAPPPAPAVEPAGAPVAPPACELHVWPAARVVARTQGMGAGFGIIGALVDSSAHADQNKRDTAFIASTLDAKAQARVLRALDLPTALHLPPSTVIIHEDGIDIKTDDAKRISDSGSKCYYEFIVRGLSYFKNAVYSGQMRTFLAFRAYDGAVLKTDFTDSKHENLTVKLPKEGEDSGPATDALITAFRSDVTFFVDKLVKKKKA